MSERPRPHDAVREYYAARAAEYDLGLHHRPEREPEVTILREAIAPLVREKSVLDVACGTGQWTKYLGEFATRVVGVDASPEVLKIAAAHSSSSSVRFILADAYSLPESLGVFEAAFVGFWISHVPRSRVGQFLESLSQRLLPSAVVILVDNALSHCIDSPIIHRDAEGNGYQSRTLLDGSVHRVLKNFPTEVELLEASDSVGRNASFRQLEHFWLFTYENVVQSKGGGA